MCIPRFSPSLYPFLDPKTKKNKTYSQSEDFSEISRPLRVMISKDDHKSDFKDDLVNDDTLYAIYFVSFGKTDLFRLINISHY